MLYRLKAAVADTTFEDAAVHDSNPIPNSEATANALLTPSS
jgi:hypothetical protein